MVDRTHKELSDDAIHQIAKTYHAQGNERSAFLEYQQVIKFDPKHKEARHGMSQLKLRR